MNTTNIPQPDIGEECQRRLTEFITSHFADKDTGKVAGGTITMTPKQMAEFIYWHRAGFLKYLPVTPQPELTFRKVSPLEMFDISMVPKGGEPIKGDSS